MKIIRIFIFLSLAFITSCQSSAKKDVFGDSGFHITDVEVAMPAQEETDKLLRYTDSFGSVIDNTVSNYASEYNATKPNANKPYALNVNVEKVHFKNALVSLLVGDANRVTGTATLIDQTTNQTVQASALLLFRTNYCSY